MYVPILMWTPIRIFINTFKNLDFDLVSDFAIAQIANNTHLNPCPVRKLGIKYVACYNHCMNLACSDMDRNDAGVHQLGK